MPDPTIKDIAKKAGVSAMAVSLALRNKAGVSEKTRQKIQKAAEELNYRQNPYVSAMMAKIRGSRDHQERPKIAYVNFHPNYVPDDESRQGPYIPSARKRCEELGFQLEIFEGNDPDLSARRLSQILYSRGIRGLVVGPARGMKGKFPMEWKRFSSAVIGYSIRNPPLHRAVNHQSHTARIALQALTDLGYSRIGLLTDAREHRRVDYNWAAGWAAFHSQQDRDPAAPILTYRDTDNQAPSQIAKWIRKHRLDAILAASAAPLPWITSQDIKVPERIGFACCQYSPLRPISGVDQNTAQIAREAVNIVAEQLLHNEVGIPEAPKTLMVEGSWVCQESTPRRN